MTCDWIITEENTEIFEWFMAIDANNPTCVGWLCLLDGNNPDPALEAAVRAALKT